ncbi:hypothetical protein ZWY2020_027969 [Hordeum vulgare]|nr:hypothetical protein ZWY2020_027969 [Hordeum vulgare]
MPTSQGDRIGVSLGSHRPIVLLKLRCLVEKKQSKVHSLAYPSSGTRDIMTSRSTYCSPGRASSSRRDFLF